jgi:hypothetical protein
VLDLQPDHLAGAQPTAIAETEQRASLETACDPGCVKTLRGKTAPGILGLMFTLRAKKRNNSSSARRHDQIRFRRFKSEVQRCSIDDMAE